MRPTLYSLRFWFAYCVFLASVSPALAQTVYYVKSLSAGNGTGLGGWQNATSNLKAVLTTAQSGDQVWIAAGLYKPTSTTARAERFAINRNLTVYGGFVGTENSPASRTLTSVSSTTLSGDIGQVGNPADNAYRVVDLPINSLSVKLDGLVIKDGRAIPGPEIPQAERLLYSVGAGLYSRYSSLTLVNCHITNNQADSQGGGAYLEAVNTQLISSQIVSNTAIGGGGGFMCISGSLNASASDFIGNIGGFNIPNVASGGQGGGISLTSAPATFDRCRFKANFSANGGAMNVQNASATLTNCLIVDNTSPFGAAAYSPTSGVLMINCTIARNQNKDANDRIIAALWGTGTLRNCIVWANHTNNQSPFPGAPFAMFNSLVQGIGPDPANGNLDGTNASLPVFVDVFTENYTLQAGSPTIDAGRNADNMTTRAFDGQDRVMGCTIDMGAFEFVQTGRPVSVSLVSASTTPATGQAVSLSALSQGGTPPFNYTWTVPASIQPQSLANTSVVSVTPTATGQQTFTVVVSNLESCTGTATLSLSVTSPPFVSLTILSNTTTICAGQTVSLTALGCSGTVVWSDGQTGNPVSITLSTSSPVSVSCIQTSAARVGQLSPAESRTPGPDKTTHHPVSSNAERRSYNRKPYKADDR